LKRWRLDLLATAEEWPTAGTIVSTAFTVARQASTPQLITIPTLGFACWGLSCDGEKTLNLGAVVSGSRLTYTLQPTASLNWQLLDTGPSSQATYGMPATSARLALAVLWVGAAPGIRGARRIVPWSIIARQLAV
jgi:hypothetical protein